MPHLHTLTGKEEEKKTKTLAKCRAQNILDVLGLFNVHLVHVAIFNFLPFEILTH